jgi:phosphohistidine phosphatase SixA
MASRSICRPAISATLPRHESAAAPAPGDAVRQLAAQGHPKSELRRWEQTLQAALLNN